MQTLLNIFTPRRVKTPAPLPLPFFPHIVRDRTTHQIIASGSAEKCRAFIRAYGHCYLDTCH